MGKTLNGKKVRQKNIEWDRMLKVHNIEWEIKTKGYKVESNKHRMRQYVE